jgi:hypothetical protein
MKYAMYGKKRIELTGIFVFLLFVSLPVISSQLFLSERSVLSAELISIDPCSGKVTLTEDSSYFYLDSVCFSISFPKDYENDIEFYDKINDDYFDLKLLNLKEVDNSNPENEYEVDFTLLEMTAYNISNTVYYKTPDEKMIISYHIDGSRVKSWLEINDWESHYLSSELYMKSVIQKGESALSHFASYAPVIDTIEQPLNVTIKEVGQNTFYEQLLYNGSSFGNLLIDPVYQVDYSPIPAKQIISGNVSGWNDSQFLNYINITSGVSDSSDATTYLTQGFVNSQLSSDSFECGSTTCGTGWASNWVLSGSASVTTANTPRGSYHLEVIEDDGSGYRTVNLASYTGDNVYFTFWHKAISLSGTSNCNYYYYDGSSWHMLMNVDSVNASSTYQFVSFEVGQKYGMASNSMIKMNITGGDEFSNDYCYIDDIVITHDNHTNGTAIVGSWNQTYDSEFQWYLRVKKTSAGTDNFYVHAYENFDEISETQTVSDLFAGIGWFNINVTSLVEYENVSAGLDYTQLRFYTNSSHYFSEVYLRKETNDTEAPQINNCQINETVLYNNDVARLRCNVTDNLDVDSVNGTIGGSTYNFTRDGDWFYYDWVCQQTNSSVDWVDISAVDILGNSNSTDPSLSLSCTYYVSPRAKSFNVSSFEFSSSEYVTVNNISYNVSFEDAYGIYIQAELSSTMFSNPVEIYMRVVTDGNESASDDNYIKRLNNEDEIGIGEMFIITGILDVGSHYSEIQIKRNSTGTIKLENVDISIISFRTTDNTFMLSGVSNGEIYNDNVEMETSNIFEITKVVPSSTFMSYGSIVETNSSGSIFRRLRNEYNNVTSSVFGTSFISDSETRSYFGSVIYDFTETDFNVSLDTSNLYSPNGMNTTEIYTIIVSDLASLSGNLLSYLYVTNNDTNYTANTTIIINDEWTNVANITKKVYSSNGYFFMSSVTVKELADNTTAGLKINITGVPSCNISRTVYLESAYSSIRNLRIIGFCEGLLAGNNYTFNMWVKSGNGTNIELIDEVLLGIETEELGISLGTHPPIPNSIINPLNNSVVGGDINITWNEFSDLGNDIVNYTVALYYVNDTIVDIIGVTNGTYQWFNSTQYSDGYYKIRVTACDTIPLCSYSEITIYLISSNETLSGITLYYPPFSSVGETVLIDAVVKVDGENYESALVSINIDGSNATMTWNSTRQSYIVYWMPTSNGNYSFDVLASTFINNFTASGSITVTNNYTVCVRLWNNISMPDDSRYVNEFAWIYAIKNLDPTLKRLFGRDKYECPPQGNTECFWHAKYDNGTACMTFYDTGNYTLYLVGNNIAWKQDIGSGFIEDCAFCPRTVIQQRLLLNLGNYNFDGNNEVIDLYYSLPELYVSGLIFGVAFSWLSMVLFFAIGLIAFGVTLKWTGSVKSALAVLLFLPTILYILLTLTLW